MQLNLAKSTAQTIHQESLTHKFVRRGVWLYFFAFLSGPIGYAIKIIISHDLSVSELGILYGTLSFILLIGSVNDLGMVESLNYFVPKFLAKNNLLQVKNYFSYAFLSMVAMSLLTSLLLYFGSGLLAVHYFNASGELIAQVTLVLQIYAGYLFISNFQHFFSTVCIVYQNTFVSRGLEMLRLAVSAVFAYVIFTSDAGSLSNYALVSLVGTGVATLIGGIVVYYRYLKPLSSEHSFAPSMAGFKELLGYSGWALLASNASFFLSQIDMQMLFQLAGPEEAGIYSNYLSLMAIPFLLLTPILGLYFPVISSLYGQAKHDQIKMVVGRFSEIFLISGIVVSCIGYLFGETLGVFFFGAAYQASGQVLYWSIAFIAFNLLLQINFGLLAGIGQVKKRLWIILIGIVINVILNYIGILYAGARWSALAVGLSWIAIWAMSYAATRQYQSGFNLKHLLRNSLIFWAITWIIIQVIPRTFVEYTELAGVLHFGYDTRVLVLLILMGVSSLYFAIFVLLHLKEIRQIRSTLALSQ
jgi:O-antigen/teichoic acid export membrane protein